jgi:hypothetical protein
MKAIVVVFVLALIAIAGGWYSDNMLMRGEIHPAPGPGLSRGCKRASLRTRASVRPRAAGRPIPIEVRPDVGATPPARLASEAWLENAQLRVAR